MVLPLEALDLVKHIDGILFYPVAHLSELLQADPPDPVSGVRIDPVDSELSELDKNHLESTFLSVRSWKAIQVAAAGWHSLLLIGPPGTGKSSMARILGSLLPPPGGDELIEIQAIAGLEGKGYESPVRVRRPVRQPHHSATVRSLVGGGVPPFPGEVTRAHNGLLILDEFAEFSRAALQSLREPIEDNRVTISRGPWSGEFPARFILAATTNPCPCGYFRSSKKSCICSGPKLRAYRQRIMGPLSDRMDMDVRVDLESDLVRIPGGIEQFRSVIRDARMVQLKRYGNESFFNGELNGEDLFRYTTMDKAAERLWLEINGKGKFSLRKQASIRRLARTLGDLAGATCIRAVDLLEASQFQLLDDFWYE